MKNCPKCQQSLPRANFAKAKLSGDGLQGWCKSCMRAYKTEYANEHGSTYNQLSNQRLRWDVLVHYSSDPPCCACCGETAYEFLAIDHINGGGRQDRITNGYGRLYDVLRRRGYPSGFRVLCHNCNQAIGHYGFCPHQSPERRLTARPEDKRKMANLASRQLVLDAGLKLAKKTRPTLETLALETGLSIPSVQRHRRFLKQSGTWKQVENS
jgi:hypothetical protein